MPNRSRPIGITALTALFVVGTIASLISAISLSFPGSFLEPIWQLNPHAREGFNRIGPWAIALMTVVCFACICTAFGLWRGLRWGYRLAILMLVLNLIGALANVISGSETRALVGIPVVLLVLAYLSLKQTRDYFRR
jgi:hypothetical protein